MDTDGDKQMGDSSHSVCRHDAQCNYTVTDECNRERANDIRAVPVNKQISIINV